MTLAERGAYRDCLDIHYAEGSIPANPNVLAGMLGVSREEFAAVWPAVSKKFHPHPEDSSRLVNDKALVVLAELGDYRAKQQQKARLGARARWGDAHGQNPACPDHAHADADTDKNYVRSDERTACAVPPDPPNAETVTPGASAQGDSAVPKPESAFPLSPKSSAASEPSSSPDAERGPSAPPPGSARPPSPRRHDYPEWFEMFWREYPSPKGSKKKALKNAKKCVPVERRAALVDDLRRRLAHMKALRKVGEFVAHMKHAEGYFSAGVWEQDPVDDLGELPAGATAGGDSPPMVTVEERERSNDEMRRLMAEHGDPREGGLVH